MDGIINELWMELLIVGHGKQVRTSLLIVLWSHFWSHTGDYYTYTNLQWPWHTNQAKVLDVMLCQLTTGRMFVWLFSPPKKFHSPLLSRPTFCVFWQDVFFLHVNLRIWLREIYSVFIAYYFKWYNRWNICS